MKALPAPVRRVIAVLRRDLTRPSKPPTQLCRGGTYIWRRRGIARCPMGLHPRAIAPAPVNHDHLPVQGLSTRDIVAFAHWWDRQRDPKAAVKAVWG
jgi:hypothetical protein